MTPAVLERATSSSAAGHRSVEAITALHAVPETWLELTQTWLYNQVTCLPESVRSHVLCETTANLDAFPFPSIHSFDSIRWSLRACDRAARKLRLRRHLGHAQRTIRRLRPQVVHSHFGPTGWELLDAVRSQRCAHVVTFYGLDVNYLPQHGWRQRYADLFEQVDLVLCEGPHMALCIVALGCPAERVRVHHLGVRTDQIEFRPRRWDRSSNQPLRVLMAASFREKKGLPYAIEALGIVSRDLNIEATIVGGPADTTSGREEHRKITEAIEASGLQDRVRLLGFQPAAVLRREALRHHLFLAPSVTAASGDTEGGAPITIIEMAASGMPIIATTHCDIPEVIIDGVSGLLAPERDAAALAARITQLASRPESWLSMLTAARARVEEQFDARTQGERLAQHYSDAIDRSQGRMLS